MEALKHVLDRHGYWPFVVTGLIFLTVPPILIHFATSARPTVADRGPPPATPPRQTPVVAPPPQAVAVKQPAGGAVQAAAGPDATKSVSVNRKLESWDTRLTITLDTIELLTAENKMRWNFSVFNQTGETQVLGGTENSYVTDKTGDTLKFLSKSTANRYTLEIPNGQKVKYWFDFQSPKTAPATLTAHFARNPYHGTKIGGPNGSLPETVTVQLPQ